MEKTPLNIRPTFRQQVYECSMMVLSVDASSLERYIQDVPKYWNERGLSKFQKQKKTNHYEVYNLRFAVHDYFQECYQSHDEKEKYKTMFSLVQRIKAMGINTWLAFERINEVYDDLQIPNDVKNRKIKKYLERLTIEIKRCLRN